MNQILKKISTFYLILIVVFAINTQVRAQKKIKLEAISYDKNSNTYVSSVNDVWIKTPELLLKSDFSVVVISPEYYELYKSTWPIKCKSIEIQSEICLDMMSTIQYIIITDLNNKTHLFDFSFKPLNSVFFKQLDKIKLRNDSIRMKHKK